MPSAIDETKPVTGAATTDSVRANFLAAKTEIEALQAALGASLRYVADSQSEPLTAAVETQVLRSYTIPANFLQVGDVIEIRDAWDTATNPAFENLDYRHRIGGDIALEDSGTPFSARSHLTRIIVQAIGVGGSGVAVGGAEMRSFVDPNVDIRAVTFDTTAPLELCSTYQWQTIVGNPEVRLEYWTVTIERPVSHG